MLGQARNGGKQDKRKALERRSKMKTEDKVAWLREQLPSVEKQVYLNGGTCGPLPKCSVTRMKEALDEDLNEGHSSVARYIKVFDQLEALREQIGSLLGVSADELTLTSGTAEGLNIVLWGMQWQPGDEILTTTQEHPSLLAPLAVLHERFGVQVRYLDLKGHAEQDCAVLKRALTPRTRLVALSHVSYTEGVVFAVDWLAKTCHEAQVPILVDGAQSMGVFPVDLNRLGVDFYAAPGQKWLCAPEGTGFLYIAKEWQSRLGLSFSGIFSVRQGSWLDQVGPHIVPAPGARRYQHKAFSRPVLWGLHTSLAFLTEEVGWDWIHERIASLRAFAREKLAAVEGLELLTPADSPSNLLSFRLAHGTPQEASAWLETQEIILRYIPTEPPMLRIAIGCYNTEADITHLCDALTRWHQQEHTP